MSKWEQFDRTINKDVVAEANTIGSQTGNFEDVPLGDYEVALQSMTLCESKKGDPMVRSCFKIVEGNYKGRLIYKNSVVYKGDVNDKYRLGSELKFLKSLGTNCVVAFQGFAHFETLVDNIFNEVLRGGLEYLLEITEKGEYRNYRIKEIYEPASTQQQPKTEQEPQNAGEDNLPF